MMQFNKMSNEEVLIYKEWAINSYAEDLYKTGLYSREEAIEVSHKEFGELFKEGIVDEANHIQNLLVEGDKVGFIWYRELENNIVWICDFLIDEPYRGRGYAKLSLKQLEHEVKRIGLSKIGLHVFSFNEKAIKLYEKCGYIKHKESNDKSIYMLKNV